MGGTAGRVRSDYIEKLFTPSFANGTLVSHIFLPQANAQTHSIMDSRLIRYANTCILAIHLGILSGGRFTFHEWCTYGCKDINTLWWCNLISFWYKCTKFGSIPFIDWSISLILFPDKEMISGFYSLLQSLFTNWWIMLLCNEAISSKALKQHLWLQLLPAN